MSVQSHLAVPVHGQTSVHPRPARALRIDLASWPAAIYHVELPLAAMHRDAVDARAALGRMRSFRGARIRYRAISGRESFPGNARGRDGFLIHLTDTAGVMHRFRGAYREVHPWLARLVRQTAQRVGAAESRA